MNKAQYRENFATQIDTFINAGGAIELLPSQKPVKHKRKKALGNVREESYQDFLRIASKQYKQFIGVLDSEA